MNILMITANDPAGMGIAFTNAINRYTPHRCRLITSAERYNFAFEKDVHLPDILDDDFGEVEFLLKNADVFHFHMLQDENAHLGPLVIRDYVRGKGTIHHQHGHPDYMLNIDAYNDKYRRLNRKVIVSTPDLLKLAENAVWVPNLVPINDVAFLPRFDATLPQDEIRVCQAPTRKYHKHTDVFRHALRDLTQRHPQVVPVIIEHTLYRECLELKKQCHLVFDHMRGWFGISSLESLSQGKPVIAGLDDWNVSRIREFTGRDRLPWVIAGNGEELALRLEELAVDSDLRQRIGEESRRFMEEAWTERHALDVLMRVYESL